jgi:hypothetical protein
MVIDGQQYSDEQLYDLIKYDRDLIRRLQADVDRFSYILELRRINAEEQRTPVIAGIKWWAE